MRGRRSRESQHARIAIRTMKGMIEAVESGADQDLRPRDWGRSSVGEHLFCKQRVEGSTPSVSTNKHDRAAAGR